MRGGAAIIDTERALLIHRAGRPPAYAFPADVVSDLPSQPEPEAPGYVVVAWEALDAWFEEGRRLVHYPPNPYHRIDCCPTTRRLRVSIGDTVLVDTDETVAVFETALAPRLYVAPGLVRTDLLRSTTTTSYCNYKGRPPTGPLRSTITSWMTSGSYEDTRPESAPIEGFLSFDSARVEVTADLPGG